MSWEYKTITDVYGDYAVGEFDETKFDERLCEMGSRGWELVSVIHTSTFHGLKRLVVATFKRPL